MRLNDGNRSMSTDARVATSADAAAVMADLSGWGGTLTACVGGHIVYAPFLAAAAAAGPVETKVVLDGSMDWRDRLLVVRARSRSNGPDIRPGGAACIELIQRVDSDAIDIIDTEFYTGGGWDGNNATARGGAGLLNFCNFLNTVLGIRTDYRIYADSTTGRLMLWNRDSTTAINGTMFIMASEQTGKIVPVP